MNKNKDLEMVEIPNLIIDTIQPAEQEPLKLIPALDPRLHQVVPELDFEQFEDGHLERIYLEMVQLMRAHNGIGLAANQVGLPYRMFILETGGEHPECFINPRIVNTESEILMEEGCLSYPGIFVKVKRPKTCRIRYSLLNRDVVTKDFFGMSARAALHEYDHLEGIVMRDRANKIHWDQAASKARKRLR